MDDSHIEGMKRILFIVFVLLSLVACKEDLSEFYNRLEQRDAANKRVEDDITKLVNQNANMDSENANLELANAAQAARNEEREQWNIEQLLRNAEQGLLNDSMRHVIDSLLTVKGMYSDYADLLKGKVDNQAQYNIDQAQRNGQLRLMWEELQQRIESLEKLLEERIEPEILSMEFLKVDNNSLRQDVKCKIIGDSIIDCWLPGKTN